MQTASVSRESPAWAEDAIRLREQISAVKVAISTATKQARSFIGRHFITLGPILAAVAFLSFVSDRPLAGSLAAATIIILDVLSAKPSKTESK